MTPPLNPQRRERNRFTVDLITKIPVRITCIDGAVGSRHSGTLTDLSVDGCQLQLAIPLPQEVQNVTLLMEQTAMAFSMETVAEICWGRQTSYGQISYGLKFHRSIPEDVLDQMIQRGLVSRRDNARCPIQLKGRLRMQLASNPPQDTEITDLSDGGVRLRTSQPLAAGERLLLELPGSLRAMLRVVWSMESEAYHFAGCAFLTNASRDAVQSAASQSA
ncbi:PilZ domain protein [Roseimaritima multifibrata]|uniref:PilZ domain protein n=1 Tax=Roseimaritima multifibrata TaxID=1930274 RepID=A0A517MJJ8_9BACT|nr:PilZ domain-containing protein [Roseimaritima multifibrata]QDS95034.1 PilZ domain protein [Roseimaritima multifibrata]